MKKNIKKLFLFMAVVATAIVCFAVSAGALSSTGWCGSNVRWNYNSYTGELILTGSGDMYNYMYDDDTSPFYNSNIRTVVISDGITSIGSDLFYSCDYLQSVSIPESVTKIGMYAFDDCSSLASIVIPSGVTSIEKYTFSDCTSLTDVVVPYNVTNIAIGAFEGCTSLRYIRIDNPYATIYDSYETISSTAVISSYTDSTARTYATKYSRSFSSYNYHPGCVAGTADSVIWTQTMAPTCTQTGTEVLYCTACGTVVSDASAVFCNPSTYPQSPHNYSSYQTYNYSFSYPGASRLVLKFNSSTKTESGYDYIYIYNAAGTQIGKYSGSQLTSKEITVTGDRFTIKLTTDGSSNYYGFAFESIVAYVAGSRVVPALGHSYASNYTVDTEGTCTTTGYKSRHCTRAGCTSKIDVTAIPGTGHTYGPFVVSSVATCTTEGVKYRTCSNCGDTETVTSSKLAHSYGEAVKVKSPTCTNEGINRRTCSACGYKKDTAIAKLGHNYSSTYTVDKKATCTTEGSKSQHCTRCSSKRNATAIPVTGHKLGSWTVVKKATCTKTGTKERVCANCFYSESQTIAKVAHAYKKVTTKATLTKNGKIQQKCSCGAVKSTTKIYSIKSVKLSTSTYTYNGKTKTPSVVVKDSNGKTLKKDTDYTVKYASGRKNPGKYTVTVTFKGKYTGTKKLTLTIKPKAPVISSVTSSTKGKAVIKWNNVAGESGYQVYYSTSKGGTYKKVDSYAANKTAGSKSKLTSKKTYYFKVRAYKKTSSGVVYSSWSSIKSVKVK